jgi:hypothetical protein
LKSPSPAWRICFLPTSERKRRATQMRTVLLTCLALQPMRFASACTHAPVSRLPSLASPPLHGIFFCSPPLSFFSLLCVSAIVQLYGTPSPLLPSPPPVPLLGHEFSSF